MTSNALPLPVAPLKLQLLSWPPTHSLQYL